MSSLTSFFCRLSSFEGPLDYLVQLVQRGEIGLADVPILTLTEQFLSREASSFESKAEFIGSAATLTWLKSKMLLLPRREKSCTEESTFEIQIEALQQLVDYCALKGGGEALGKREGEENRRYRRGAIFHPEAKEKRHGLETSLGELLLLFQQAVRRRSSEVGQVEPEEWPVADAIVRVKQLLHSAVCLKLGDFFSTAMCRLELIATFLALLELMKRGELSVNGAGLVGEKGDGEFPSDT